MEGAIKVRSVLMNQVYSTKQLKRCSLSISITSGFARSLAAMCHVSLEIVWVASADGTQATSADATYQRLSPSPAFTLHETQR